MRTFYHNLDDLEAAGLIDRRPQARYVEAGLFGRAYLHLTERAVALLSAGNTALRSEEAIAIREALNSLGTREQEIMRASVEGYSRAEIAEMFDMTEGNVRVVLCRARKELARILSDHHYGDSDQ